MGRFYRTAAARPVDYMHRLNTPLMERVLAANEGFINTRLDVADKLAQFDYEHIDKDDPEAQRLIKEYNDYGEMLSSGIRENAANWREFTPQIKYVQNKLLKDYKTGTIGKQVANFAARKAAFEKADKDEELYRTSGGDKGTNPTAVKLYKQWWDDNFTGTGTPETGGYNVYRGGSTRPDINVEKVLAEGIKDMKADASNRWYEGPQGPMIWNKVTEEYERVTPERILGVMAGRVPGLIPYLSERQNIGEIQGVFDDAGRFIQPYSYDSVESTPEERTKIETLQRGVDGFKGSVEDKKKLQDALDSYKNTVASKTELGWNEESYLAPMMRSIVGLNAWSKYKGGNDLSGNPAGIAVFNQGEANFRQDRQLKQAKTIHDENIAMTKDHFDRTLEQRKWEWEHPHTKGTGTTGTPGLPGAAPEVPVENSTSDLSTNLYNNWKVFSPVAGKNVPVVSTAGLSASIENTRGLLAASTDALARVNTQLSNPNTPVGNLPFLRSEKARLEQDNLQYTSDLGKYRSWYKSGDDAVLTNKASADGELFGGVNITKEQVANYRAHDNDRKGEAQLARVVELEKQYPPTIEYPKDPITGQPKTYDAITGAPVKPKKIDHPVVAKARAEWKTYISDKALIDKARDNVFNKMREQTFETNSINVGSKARDIASNIILNNTQGMAIFDWTGKPASGQEIDAKGMSWNDEYTFDFVGQNNISQYLRDNPNVKMVVEQIGITTKLNRGMSTPVAKVHFENTDGSIPNTFYYITLNQSAASDLSNLFKDDKNASVKEAAIELTDAFSASLRTQFAEPSINEALGRYGREPYNYNIFVPAPDGSTKTLNVIPIREEGNESYYITIKQDGKDMNFPKFDSQGNIVDNSGIFAHREEGIQGIKNAMKPNTNPKANKNVPIRK